MLMQLSQTRNPSAKEAVHPSLAMLGQKTYFKDTVVPLFASIKPFTVGSGECSYQEAALNSVALSIPFQSVSRFCACCQPTLADQ